MADFGKLNFSVAFNPTTAFPLDARYYFATLAEAQAAAAAAVEVGSSDGTYFFGESICVVADGVASLYIIQPNKTLKPVGTEVLGDDKSIEIKAGKVTVKGFDAATAGQQPRINAAGNAIEWYTPDTSTVSGLADTVAGHTTDIGNLQNSKADKATTLDGYGITDAMTATAIGEAIQAAIAATGHASFKKVEAVPAVEVAEDNILYLVMNADTGYYDIYAKVDNVVVRLDDVSVNLDAYSTTEQMNTAIAEAIKNKVDAKDGMGLSSNDYTAAEKEKLAGIAAGAEVNVVKSASDEFAISDAGELSLAGIEMAKVTGLPDALKAKVDAVDGIGGEGEKATVVAYVTDAIAALKIGDYAKAADLTKLAGRVSTVEGKAHEHTNKAVLDGITAEKITAWDGKADADHKHDISDLNQASGYIVLNCGSASVNV